MAANAPTPADEPTFTDEHFGLELFWEKNSKWILAGAAALVLAIIGTLAFLIYGHNARLAAEEALAAASGIDELREVVKRHGGTPAARSADLLLAQAYREEGEYSQSDAIYESLEKSPLGIVAAFGRPANAAAQGNGKEYSDLLSMLANTGSPETAPVALLLLSGEEIAAGDLAGAKAHLESINIEYPSSVPALIAPELIQQITLVLPTPVTEAAPVPQGLE